MICKENLFEEILLSPAQGCDKLCVISGYATPSMADYNLKAIRDRFDKDINIDIVVGMAPASKISENHHKNFQKLMADKGNFRCSYININANPIHSKVYIWLKNNKPVLAFLASANYTHTAFYHKTQDEIATICDPDLAFEYYNSKTDFTVYCDHSDAEDLVVRSFVTLRERVVDSMPERSAQPDTIRLALFSESEGRMHERGGLNWGQRDGREPNQAYIFVPRKKMQANPDFFPPLGVPFSVLTDDGFPFVCVMAQPKTKGKTMPSAIETTNNNSELGIYFRNKLGVPLGQFVTLEDLDRYGNRYVTFTKINDDEYYMQY